MSKKILIFIGVGILIVGFGVGGYFFLIPRCPESCDDGNPCTQDICSKETNYKCSYTKLTGPQLGCSAEVTCGKEICKAGVCQIDYISDCCGNKVCEVGETYKTCSVECPNCDDDNKCTKDSYDYHEQKCINRPILEVICCGNSVCEIGENYQNCARDCPNCDDEDKCTRDTYDYHKQKCLNEIIIPCCGNGICDKGVETYLNCSADCPNCDDKNKFTADSFNYKTQLCENIVTHYFIDDFEGDIKNWIFHGEGNWSTVVENGNTVLKVIGVEQANLQKEWDNYAFKFRFKRIDGSVHVDFRRSCTKDGCNRYFVSISEVGVHGLRKQMGENWRTLVDVDFKLDKNWHTLEIRGYSNILNVYMDDELIIKSKDTEDPLLSGWVRFEFHTGGIPEMVPEFLIDDVEIKVVTEEDIIYP